MHLLKERFSGQRQDGVRWQWIRPSADYGVVGLLLDVGRAGLRF